MPVYTIVCPDCGQVMKSLVLEGTRMPEAWTCSACGGRDARPDPAQAPQPHPWESPHGTNCPCCG